MRSPYLSIESMAQPNETRVRDKNFTCTQLRTYAVECSTPRRPLLREQFGDSSPHNKTHDAR